MVVVTGSINRQLRLLRESRTPFPLAHTFFFFFGSCAIFADKAHPFLVCRVFLNDDMVEVFCTHYTIATATYSALVSLKLYAANLTRPWNYV